MTTKVTIFNHGHHAIEARSMTITHNDATTQRTVNSRYILQPGNATDVYVHAGQYISIEEIPTDAIT